MTICVCEYIYVPTCVCICVYLYIWGNSASTPIYFTVYIFLFSLYFRDKT